LNELFIASNFWEMSQDGNYDSAEDEKSISAVAQDLLKGNDAPVGYLVFRITFPDTSTNLSPGALFKLLLHVFYSSIIIENEDFIPADGHPCIICANHSNSVMDAVVLVTSVSLKVLALMIVYSY